MSILTSPRFSFEPPPAGTEALHRVRAAWISDVHLGTRTFRVDAVLCGHIHSAAVHQFAGVTYYNCGDWVESCTAMVERHDGRIELVSYPPFPASRSAKIAVPEGVL